MKQKKLPGRPRYKYLGMLPEGDWTFMLVQIEGRYDALIAFEATGRQAPRMVVDGKLLTIAKGI